MKQVDGIEHLASAWAFLIDCFYQETSVRKKIFLNLKEAADVGDMSTSHVKDLLDEMISLKYVELMHWNNYGLTDEGLVFCNKCWNEV